MPHPEMFAPPQAALDDGTLRSALPDQAGSSTDIVVAPEAATETDTETDIETDIEILVSNTPRPVPVHSLGIFYQWVFLALWELLNLRAWR